MQAICVIIVITFRMVTILFKLEVLGKSTKVIRLPRVCAFGNLFNFVLKR